MCRLHTIREALHNNIDHSRWRTGGLLRIYKRTSTTAYTPSNFLPPGLALFGVSLAVLVGGQSGGTYFQAAAGRWGVEKDAEMMTID